MPSAAVNGATLHYEEQGRGQAILFLHGTGAHSPAAWERCIDAMPPGRRLITYDRRGFGQSGAPLASGLQDHVEDAAALLEHLGAAPAAIVTQSGGAVIALRLAIDRPDLIHALIMGEPAYQVALHPSLSVTRALARTLGKWVLRRDVEGAAVHYYRWATRYETGGTPSMATPCHGNGRPLSIRWRRFAKSSSSSHRGRAREPFMVSRAQ